jgi:hypothetical protein
MKKDLRRQGRGVLMSNMKTACVIRKTEFGQTIYHCQECRMTECQFLIPAEAADLKGMCRYNLDPTETPGSPEEVTDFCFNRDVREMAREGLRKPD